MYIPVHAMATLNKLVYSLTSICNVKWISTFKEHQHHHVYLIWYMFKIDQRIGKYCDRHALTFTR